MSASRLSRDLDKLVDKTMDKSLDKEAVTFAIYQGIEMALSYGKELDLNPASRVLITDFQRDIQREGRFACLQARRKT